MEKNIRSVNNTFNIALFYLFSKAVPRSLHTYFINTVGKLFPYTMRNTGWVIRKNLEVIGGGQYGEQEIKKRVETTFKNYGRYLLDYMAMHRIGEHNQHIYLDDCHIGEEYFTQAERMGRGIILITPHLGNWELGGIFFALKGYKLNVLSVTDTNHKARRFREIMREKYGINTIYVDGDGMQTMIQVVNALKRKEIVALLGDRDGSPQTIEADFFGRKTKFPVGVAYIALASGAPVLPVFVLLRKSGRYQGIVEKPVLFQQHISSLSRKDAIQTGIQEIVSVFERYIRKYPDQWYNFYPFWEAQGQSRII